ncbi:MAG: peptidase dimerization domain-containing protein [Candidatus Peribacteria bacterium]|nr:peptidase dimerization domain-containing protein [Candidatus Peribacteria bacterium]
MVDGTQNRVGTTLSEFLEQHREELKADFCFCSAGNGVEEKPTLEVGQRGGMNFDIVLSDTLSGNNTVLEMSKLLTKFYNSNKIAIPYFYYNVERNKPEAEIRRYGTNLEYRTITRSVKPNHTILEPTLEITGIISLPKFEKSQGMPKKAIANFQMYLVPNQNFQEIINGVRQRLKMVVPPQMKTELIVNEAYDPCKFSLQNAYAQKAIALLAGAFKTPVEYQQKKT